MYFATGASLTAAIAALPSTTKGNYKAFDDFYYAQLYMGSYSGSLSPIEHFVQIGAARGNKPNADFDPAFYKAQYADLKNTNFDAADLLFHYVNSGLNEGRIGNATLASSSWSGYLTAYPDVATYVNANLASFGGSTTNGAVAHYAKFGQYEGRAVPGGPSSGQTFTLTTGVDAPAGTVGNDTFNATGATLGVQDTITGGNGTDKLVIVDTTKASEAGLAAATITGVEALELNANGGIGAFVTAGKAAVAGTAQTATITYSASTAATASVVIAGVTYTTATATADASGSDVADKIVVLINAALGGTAAVKSGTGPSVVTITSPFAGTPLPTLSISGAGGTSALGVVAGTANVEKVSTAAAAQIIAFTLSGTGHASDNSYTIYIDGVNRGTVLAGADTTAAAGKATGAAVIAAEINKVLPGHASSTGAVVSIAAPVAGTPLPIISVIAGGTTNTVTRTEARSNADAVVADTAAAVYNAAAFTEAFTANGAGDMNVKAAATTAVNLTNTTGKIVVDTAKTVVIATTGSGTTDVTGKTLESVSIKGGGNVVVDNLLNTSAGTTAVGTSMTTATLTGIAGTTAALKGAALTTVNINSQISALATTLTNDTSTALTINTVGSGFDATGAGVTVSVAAGSTAATINVNATGAKSSLTVTAAAAKTLNITGSGALTLAPIASVTKLDASTATGALILGTLNAATLDVKTGTGADTFTTDATAKIIIDTGSGNDNLTLGQILAAGSTVTLGIGDDTLLGAALPAVSTTAAVTVIDGGVGNDTVASTLINAGNAAQFINFERIAIGNVTSDAALLTKSTITGVAIAGSTGTGVIQGITKDQSLFVTANNGGTSATLTFTGVTGTADAYAINFGATTTGTAASPTSIDAKIVAIEGIEVVTVNSASAAGVVTNAIALKNATATSLTITGDQALNVTFNTAFGTSGASTGVSSIDGSTATGKLGIVLTGVVAAAAGITVKGGSAADSITTIASQAATLTGGAGSDSFVVASTIAGTTDAATAYIPTITDFAKGDKITFNDIGDTAFTTTAVNVSGAVSLDAAVDLAVAATTGHTNAEVKYFVYGGNTYITVDGSASATLAATADQIIKLTGIHDLSTSTITTAAVFTYA